jgi:hypothetical protein
LERREEERDGGRGNEGKDGARKGGTGKGRKKGRNEGKERMKDNSEVIVWWQQRRW